MKMKNEKFKYKNQIIFITINSFFIFNIYYYNNYNNKY